MNADQTNRAGKSDPDEITNDERASWAEVALVAFGQRTGMVLEAVGDDEDPLLIVVDLLADLAHWCDRNNVDLQEAIARATRHYQDEIGPLGKQLLEFPVRRSDTRSRGQMP